MVNRYGISNVYVCMVDFCITVALTLHEQATGAGIAHLCGCRAEEAVVNLSSTKLQYSVDFLS